MHVIQSEDDRPPQLAADPASGATDSRDSIINDSQSVDGSRQPSLSDTQYRASSLGRRHTPPSSGLVRHVWGAAEPSVTTGEFFHIVSQKLFWLHAYIMITYAEVYSDKLVICCDPYINTSDKFS